NIPPPVPSAISPFKVKCAILLVASPSFSTVSVNGSISDELSSLKSEDITVEIELITTPPSTITTAITIAMTLFFDISIHSHNIYFNLSKYNLNIINETVYTSIYFLNIKGAG